MSQTRFVICEERSQRQARKPEEPDWREELPLSWFVQVVVPKYFSFQRDYEINAARVIGDESEGQPCYCRYDAVLTELRSDDDEYWFSAPVYGEQLSGWRLIDDRWLIHRRIFHGEDCQFAQSFFTFAEEMPR